MMPAGLRILASSYMRGTFFFGLSILQNLIIAAVIILIDPLLPFRFLFFSFSFFSVVGCYRR